jgi:phospholipid-binding lipoprotein MlaA
MDPPLKTIKSYASRIKLFHYIRLSSLVGITLSLIGCATTGPNNDPYEGYNRKVFKFNMAVDRGLFRPIASAYAFVTPKPVRRSVTNFFANVDEIPNMGNDLLQANFPWLFSDAGRFMINSTLGIGGLFDVASMWGLERHKQDFGLTLATWGWRKSPYLMVPLLPPSTPRDLVGFGGDIAMSPWTYIEPSWVGYAAYGLEFVNKRANLLPMDKLVDEAFDPYVFVREAYLQNREAQIQKVLHPTPRASYNPAAPPTGEWY